MCGVFVSLWLTVLVLGGNENYVVDQSNSDHDCPSALNHALNLKCDFLRNAVCAAVNLSTARPQV